jgi:hypothetical protein
MTMTVPTATTAHVRPRPAGCPDWCRVSHDRLRDLGWSPQDDRGHYSDSLNDLPDGRSQRGWQTVEIHQGGRRGRRGTAEVRLNVIGARRGGDVFDVNGCNVGLSAGEARALAAVLLKAADLIEAPDFGKAQTA